MNIEERIKHYREHKELTGHDFNCADPGACQLIEMLLEKITELRDWVNTIASGERIDDLDKILEGVQCKANDTADAAEKLTTLLKEEK